MPEILIQSKITTPHLNSKIVHRERLTSLLDKNINKNLIIICAPAGFGKTTLVLDYLNRDGIRHAWFSIPHKGIADASTFFEYLLNAFANIEKDFGAGTMEVMKQFAQSPQMAKELVSGCTASFVNEFQKHFKDNITLVIDDLHFIDSEKSLKWLKEFFDELYENIPPNLHLHLVTRVMPELNMTNLKAKRNIFMITEKELTFDIDETGELLSSVYGYNYSKEDLNQLEDNLKGWITGLHLLLQAYGEDYKNVKYKGDIGYSSIFDFFAQEIFDNLSSELQEFLLVTSLMDNFDESTSNAVLEIKNSRDLLNELIKRNLFIQQSYSTGNDGCIKYNYHALFRNFLNQRIKKSRINDEINKLMEKIADNYLKSGDEVTAINYFLEAENYEKAVTLYKKNITILGDEGKYNLIWRWTNLLPKDIVNSDAELLYIVGHMYCFIVDDYKKSLSYIDMAISLFMNSNHAQELFKCNMVKAAVLRNTGRTEEAKMFLENLLKTNLKPENKIHAIATLCEVYNLIGLRKKALDLLEKTDKFCDENNVNKSDLYHAFSITYSRMGDIKKAMFYLEEELKIETNISNIIGICAGIADCYAHIGDYSNSIRYFSRANKLLKNSYSKHRFIGLSNKQAILFQCLGDIEESNRILKKVLQIAEHSDLWYFTHAIFLNYYALNDRNNSLKYLNLYRLNTMESSNEVTKKLLIFMEALFSLKYDFNSTVIKKFSEAYEFFNSNNDCYKSLILSYIPDYYLKINDANLVIKYLTESLKNDTFYANDLKFSRGKIDFALSRPELAQYKDKVHCAFTEFFDRLNIEGTTDEYKKKMKIEIEKLYDIKMISFVALEFISRGEPVEESKWKKKKGKSILAYIMINPKAKYSKDKIIDMFFPDARPETVEDSFKQAVFSIRSTFKNPYLNFLILENKMLYLNPDCYFKSDADEFNKLCTVARSAEKTVREKMEACKAAIDLYKGEFLEGNYEPWCEDLREEFHNKFISVSELLLDLLNREGKYEEIIHFSGKLLTHDKLNEIAYLSLVEAFVKTEKLKSARDIYSKMLKTYEDELGETPDQNTLRKVKSLLGN